MVEALPQPGHRTQDALRRLPIGPCDQMRSRVGKHPMLDAIAAGQGGSPERRTGTGGSTGTGLEKDLQSLPAQEGPDDAISIDPHPKHPACRAAFVGQSGSVTMARAFRKPLRTFRHHALDSDSTALNQNLELIFLFEHDLFGKPVSTFPDHALVTDPGSCKQTLIAMRILGQDGVELVRAIGLEENAL